MNRCIDKENCDHYAPGRRKSDEDRCRWLRFDILDYSICTNPYHGIDQKTVKGWKEVKK